ncbi:MAG: hypothetical protein HRT37_20490 [Alteromonadaceae bacterium]|nr:hypothetical protein [Alteromonadaceae bacterium]NQZ64616.1 hypothetical protein [Crocosphaera sp.]
MKNYTSDDYSYFKEIIFPSLDFIENKACRLLARFSNLYVYLLFVIPVGTIFEFFMIMYTLIKNKFNANFLKGNQGEMIIMYGILAVSMAVWSYAPYTVLIFFLISYAILKIFKVPRP